MRDEYFLRTARLGFRCWTADDLPLALALWGDPAVTRLIGGPFSGAQIWERLQAEIAAMAAHRVQYWPIFLLSGGAHVGCCGLRVYDLSEEIYELGFHLRAVYWGQRFAVEAGRAVIEFAFTGLRARGLFAGHHPANTASRVVLERLGFRLTHEEFYAPTGLTHPSYRLTPPSGAAKTRPSG